MTGMVPEVSAQEAGMIRVVAGSGAEEGAAAAVAARLLGLTALAPDGVEAVDMADLGELGLSGYLREAYDVAEAALAGDAAALDALEGRVFLVFSAAFGGQGARLVPGPGVRVFGPYAEARAASALPVPAPREEPVQLAPPMQRSVAGPPLRVPLALLALVGLPVLALLIWWLS